MASLGIIIYTLKKMLIVLSLVAGITHGLMPALLLLAVSVFVCFKFKSALKATLLTSMILLMLALNNFMFIQANTNGMEEIWLAGITILYASCGLALLIPVILYKFIIAIKQAIQCHN